MKIQFTSSTLSRQFNAGGIIRVLFLALAVFAAPSALSAQEQGIITLLPIEVQTEGAGCKSMTIQGQNNKPKCKVILRFHTNSIPTGAKVNAAHLMMVGGMKATQTITVYVNDLDVVFGEITPVANQSFPANKRADWAGTEEFRDKIDAAPAALFSLILQTASGGLASEWKNDMVVSGSRPRLTLEYTVAGRERILQSEGVPATTSPTSFLPTPTVGAHFGSREVSGIWSFAPVFYNGLVYLIRENQLQALTALGTPPLWSLPLDKPGQHLLLSRSGRLYIVGAGKILVYQLHPDPKSPATEVTTSGGQPLSPKLVTNLNPLLAPAVGADGSLYFVNGQEVYGQNADLQQLWKVTLTNTTTSRVTVGPSGRFVYLTAKGKGLVAIDAQTGESATVKSDDSQSMLAEDTNITFHAPVVIQHPDGTEKIYVAANSVDDGVLADFDNPRTKPKQRTVVSITEDWEPLPGLWSQPLPDLDSPGTINKPSTTKRIYAVNVKSGQGTLKAINWLSGSAHSQAPSFSVAASPDLLNIASNGGVLGVDKHGAVFVWDGNGVKLYVFTPQGSVAALPLAASSGFTVGSRLAFGSDGTLYLADAGNAANRTLRAIVPQYTLEKVSAEKIFSPTHLRVDGIVDKNTELTAPGSVFLRDGFTVKQGVTLTVKQPKP